MAGLFLLFFLLCTKIYKNFLFYFLIIEQKNCCGGGGGVISSSKWYWNGSTVKLIMDIKVNESRLLTYKECFRTTVFVFILYSHCQGYCITAVVILAKNIKHIYIGIEAYHAIKAI